MNIRPSSYFLMALLAVILAVTVYLLTLPSLETKLIPLVVSVLVLVLGAIELRKELLTGREAKAAGEPEANKVEAEARGGLGGFLVGWGWMVGFLLAVLLVGFIIATPLFSLSYLKLNGRRWPLSIGVAAALTILLYAIFVVGLKINLYPGLIFGGHF